MFLAPLIERELRRALHRNRGTKSRFRVALMGVGLVVLFFCMVALGGSVQWGRTLHRLFFWMGLYLAIGPAMRISVGLFSEERRNQTLELLFLTGIGSGELFVGKLLGGSLIASSDLLALAPLLALPFLMGGISLDAYLATLACFPMVLLVVIAVGVLASVQFKDDGSATIFTVVIAGCISLATPLPYYLGTLLMGSPPFASKWLCLSPAYAPYLVSINFGTAGRWEFWITELIILAWSGLWLGLACLILGRNWRAQVQGTAQLYWPGCLAAWLGVNRSCRTAWRDRLLAKNPFQWLIQKDHRPVLMGYATIGLLCLLWLLGWHTWPHVWPSTANFFITAMLLLAIVNWLRLFAAARRLAMDRRDGALELLLTTPLAPQEIVDGQVDALTQEFKPLQYTVLVLLILMMLGGFFIRSWNARAVIAYLVVWGVLCGWCLRNLKGRILKVMWAALNTGRPAYAVFKWRDFKWSWFWMAYNIRFLLNSGLGSSAAGFPSGSTLEFTLLCIIIVPAGVFYFLGRAAQREIENLTRKRLVTEMRLIATEPLPDPNDPSFENWDNVQRLQYLGASNRVPNGWPAFADPVHPVQLRRQRDSARPQKESDSKIILLHDTLHLFGLLEEQRVPFVIVGGLAMKVYVQDRTANDADILMSARALECVAELQIQERTDFFCRAHFRGIRVVVYLVENPFFEAIRVQFATKVALSGMGVTAATVEGLLALNLYAIYLISRQRDFYRHEPYEVNIIALLACYEPQVEPIFALLRAHIPEQGMLELEDCWNSCAKYARRLRKRE